jgi:hypothetical protein
MKPKMPPVASPTPQELTTQLNAAQTALNAKTSAPATVQPTVSANDLVNPAPAANPPAPAVNTNDGSRLNNLVGNVANNTQTFIQSQSEEATRARELAGLLGTQTFDGAGERERMGKELGVSDNLTRLTDIQTQLARQNTDSALTQTRIAGAAGQTLGQAGREITQEDRENAIRTAGLAAEASVLQGNIETASTLINQAMSDYYQDRQLTNQNMIQQLDYFSSVADKQTAQLLEKEKRVYEEDQRQIEYVKSSVDAALKAGASPAEINQLVSPQTTEAEKLALAQKIVGARAFESVEAEAQYRRIRNATASMEYNNALNALNTLGETGLDEGQRTKIAAMPEAKNSQALITLNANMTRLRDLYDANGSWNPINRDAAKEIASLRSQLEIDIAVAGGQGAISEQEADRYANIVGGGWFQKGSSVAKSIDAAITTNDEKIKRNIAFVDAAIPGANAFEPFQMYLSQKQAEEYIDQQLQQQEDAIDSYVDSFSTSATTSQVIK